MAIGLACETHFFQIFFIDMQKLQFSREHPMALQRANLGICVCYQKRETDRQNILPLSL